MSQTLSLRVPDQMMERLERLAHRQGSGMTRTKVSILLLEEALREADFPLIEYRDGSTGRQPCVRGSGMAVWELILVARSYQFDAERIAQDYPLSVNAIRGAFNYFEAYQDEINRAIEDNQIGYDTLKQFLPNARLFTLPSEVAAGESRA